MMLLLSAVVVSAAGWAASLTLSRSAARRHIVLSTALVACLLLPMVWGVRSGTGWTLLAVRHIVNERGSSAPETAWASTQRPAEGRSSQRDLSESDTPGGAEFTSADPRETAGQPPATGPSDTSRSARYEASRRLSPAALNTPGVWSAARRWAAVVYAVVSGAMLVRLLLGLEAVRRVRRWAVEVDTLDDGVRLLEADVACPLAVGFGRPAIVVPRQFRGWVGSEELRDVLTHEAEHLRRGDHWMMLLQRLTAAAYWPIVTVHLLNRALDRAREELCDNAVLAARDPAAYGQTLLLVARLASRRLSVVTPLAASVVWRGELERRVAGLLDGRRDRRTKVGRPARWTITATLAGVAILAGTTRVTGVADKAPPDKSQAARPAGAEVAPAKSDIDWTGVPKVDPDNPTLHRGVVLGPDGKPVAGASIYAASTIELLEVAEADEVGVDDLGPMRTVTDEHGRFEFRAPDLSWVTVAGERKRWETLLVATKEGLSPGWLKTWGDDRNFRSHWHPWKSRDVAVRMRPPSMLTGRLLLQGGAPLAGARVRLTGLMAPIEYDLDKHIAQEERDALSLFETIDYAEELYRPWVLPALKTEATTNDEGHFELQGLPEGYIAGLEITHPQAETTSLRVAVRPMEPVYREPPFGEGEPTLTLYGSGFTAEAPKGGVLRGQAVITSGWDSRAAPGVIVSQANHNAKDGLSGQRFRTDAEGRFEVTGLHDRPEGYELAFVGSFAAPTTSRRQRIVPDEQAKVKLQPAAPYRLTLTDERGHPIDREVYSLEIQETPGSARQGVKWRFNDAERVAPGIYQGIVPVGPGAVLVQRGAKTDRPVAVDPKEFFAPGRTDWTGEEALYAYGDTWRIAYPAVITTEELAVGSNPTVDQLDLAAVIFTNARVENGVLELAATVESDPPVQVTLVDEAGAPVAGATVERQMERSNAKDLPANFPVYGLHPRRAEFLVFQHEQRGLIGTLSKNWTDEPVHVVMQPAARLLGRFTDAAGTPNYDFGVRILGERIMPGTFVAGRMFQTTNEIGERPGEFRLLVPPGAEIRGEFVRKTPDRDARPSAGVAFGPLTPEPGETVDFGDLTVP
jgi:Zn-dependent protease with chaperone function